MKQQCPGVRAFQRLPIFASLALLVVVLAPCAARAQFANCGNSTTLNNSVVTFADGSGANYIPIDVTGARYGFGDTIAPANGSIALAAGIVQDYILGGDFWNAIDSANCGSNSVTSEECNHDPHVVVDPSNGQFTMVSVAGNQSQLLAQTRLYIATANQPASLHSGWTKFPPFVTCSNFPSSAFVDDPRIAFSGNWIIVETDCFNSSGVHGGSQIDAIEKSALYSGAFHDHVFASLAPGNYYESPLSTLNQDATAYLATPEPGDAGATVVISSITGSITSPSYAYDIGTGMISVSGTKSGKGRIPDLNQKICTHCLGHAKNAPIPFGDEDVWANGHATLEVAFSQKYGGSSEGAVDDGSAISEVVTWDTVTKTTPFTFWTQDSTKGGGISHSWPSIAHTVVSGSDRAILTDTLSRHQTGNLHHPTNEVLRILPSLSTLVQNESSVDASGPDGNRWGDYSTTTYDPVRGKFESFGDCTTAGPPGAPGTEQFNTYNEIAP